MNSNAQTPQTCRHLLFPLGSLTPTLTLNGSELLAKVWSEQVAGRHGELLGQYLKRNRGGIISSSIHQEHLAIQIETQ